MMDKIILDSVSKLNQLELYELNKHVQSLIKRPWLTYIQRPSKCGQSHCKKCRNGGKGHGMYWFAKFRYQGRQHMAYVGKQKKEIDVLGIIRRKNRRIKDRGI